jgi:cob(I)alamin adenosyltransferase
MREGQTHVYTGNGKGKTTAALGLSIRAAGAGHRVFFLQFLKLGDYSELKSLARFEGQIEVAQHGSGGFVRGAPTPKDLECARAGLAAARAAIGSGRFDLVVLDEAVVAVRMGLIPEEELLALVREKPLELELVLTGRGASPALTGAADLVTEMVEVKHYFHKGVTAREGVER